MAEKFLIKFDPAVETLTKEIKIGIDSLSPALKIFKVCFDPYFHKEGEYLFSVFVPFPNFFYPFSETRVSLYFINQNLRILTLRFGKVELFHSYVPEEIDKFNISLNTFFRIWTTQANWAFTHQILAYSAVQNYPSSIWDNLEKQLIENKLLPFDFVNAKFTRILYSYVAEYSRRGNDYIYEYRTSMAGYPGVSIEPVWIKSPHETIEFDKSGILKILDYCKTQNLNFDDKRVNFLIKHLEDKITEKYVQLWEQIGDTIALAFAANHLRYIKEYAEVL